jgi:23S rRNA (uracil1939-C5)-methyltransferase
MPTWQQGQALELEITDLSDRGDGVGRWQDRVVFVPDTVPGDCVRVRLTQVKPTYGFGKPVALLTASADRVRPACIVADKCGGCQWQAVAYPAQLAAKQRQVAETLRRLGGLTVTVDPVLPAASPLGYRNKATYPLVRSASGEVKAGYYRQGSHQIVNLNQCPVQDLRLNPLLAGIKGEIATQGWSIYSEAKHRGRLRHLSLRIGRRTGQILATLVSTEPLENLAAQAARWLSEYDGLVGVCLNLNPARTNAIFGPDTQCLAGQPYLEETLADLRFRIQSTTFFQVNTEQAERLVQVMLSELNLQGDETILDAYCGIGTLTLPLARQAARCIGLESQAAAVAQALENAELNDLQNVEFQVGPVEARLPAVMNDGLRPDIVVLDPPRKGCDPSILAALIDLKPQRIVYMSCNPATLARDLKTLCGAGPYRLQRLQPADFFPQTAHVECMAFLEA